MAKKSFNAGLDGLLQSKQVQKPDSQNREDFIKRKLKINPKIKQIIPPLSKEEYHDLERNILLEGCRDPLVVWEHKKNEFILIDGHNRHEICSKHKLPFDIVEVKTKLQSFVEVENWMISNQLGKRNLSEDAKSYFRGKQYAQSKKKLGAREGNKNASKKQIGQNVPFVSTYQQMAQEYQVSAKTIQRDEKYAEAIDIVVGGDDELKRKILFKEIHLPKNTILQLAQQPSKELTKIRKELLQNTFVTAPKTNPVLTQTKETVLISSLHKKLKQASKNKDKASFLEAKKYLEELEKLLFVS